MTRTTPARIRTSILIAIGLLAAMAIPAAASTFTVDPTYSERTVFGYPHTSFQDTGVAVASADRLVMAATGTACAQSDTACFTPDGGGTATSTYLAPSLSGGALIGRIGTTGTAFVVGSSYDQTVIDSGTLYLGFNDSRSDDNTGEFVVDITVNPDALGPVSRDVTADPNPAPIATDVTVTAIVDDSATGNSPIASAHVSVDNGGTWTPADPADGSYDTPVESVTAAVTTTADADVIELCVRGTDTAGNIGQAECAPVAVYDPDGGFVTGGGWINSPAGAHTPENDSDADVTGRANFGFVAKYKRGATAPSGHTEFQFQAADLNFASASYEWLVVSGSRAQYKGAGTINGQGAYRFLLTATDNGEPGTDDQIRMKIWDPATDEVVYDNQHSQDDSSGTGTTLSGGNVYIHTR